MGGLSRRFVKMNELRDSGLDPLIIDAGDLFFSTANINSNNKESELYRAGAILEGYDRVGCDAINIGHYEVLNGLSFLKNMEEKTEIPFLSANLRDSKTNKLLFEPFRIIVKESLKIGIVGVTDKLPDTTMSMIADDYIEAGNHYIDEVSNQADIIVIMVNSDRKTYSELPTVFSNADFIVTSGSTNMTRENTKQKDGGPFLYSCGKQGKYMSVLSVEIEDKKAPIVDVSSHEKNISSIHKRFERLQKKDPNKSLDELYAGQANVLKIIEQNRIKLKESETAIKSAQNTLKFETIPLNKKIKDNPELLAFVDESLATCTSLKPKTAKITPNPKPNKKGKPKPKQKHIGHDH